MKISILIPCFNSSKYLDECLYSLAGTPLRDIEFICINDGSSDNTREILEKFEKRDARFKIINKANSGYGDSLNQALKVASGKYIGIVESDDFIEPSMFERLLFFAEKYELDTIRCNYYEFSEGKDSEYFPRIPKNKVIKPLIVQEPFYASQGIWSHLYRRDFLDRNNIRFLATPGASFQDTSFIFKILAMSNRYMYLDEALYHYRIDNASSSINNKGKLMCVCDEWKEIQNFYLSKREELHPLSGILLKLKYRTYRWNYERLSPALKKEFISVWSKEFREDILSGTFRFWTNSPKSLLKYLLISFAPSIFSRLLNSRL